MPIYDINTEKLPAQKKPPIRHRLLKNHLILPLKMTAERKRLNILNPFLGTPFKLGPMAISMKDKCFRIRCTVEAFSPRHKAIRPPANSITANHTAWGNWSMTMVINMKEAFWMTGYTGMGNITTRMETGIKGSSKMTCLTDKGSTFWQMAMFILGSGSREAWFPKI